MQKNPDWDKRLDLFAQQLECKEIATPERLTAQEGQPQEGPQVVPPDGPAM